MALDLLFVNTIRLLLRHHLQELFQWPFFLLFWQACWVVEAPENVPVFVSEFFNHTLKIVCHRKSSTLFWLCYQKIGTTSKTERGTLFFKHLYEKILYSVLMTIFDTDNKGRCRTNHMRNLWLIEIGICFTWICWRFIKFGNNFDIRLNFVYCKILCFGVSWLRWKTKTQDKNKEQHKYFLNNVFNFFKHCKLLEELFVFLIPKE